MSRSIRYIVRRVVGRSRQNFNWPIITQKSVIHITAGECKFGTTEAHPTDPKQDFHYVLGDADVWVTNISPHRNEFSGQPGGVEYILHTNFPNPIDVAVTITVEDNIPIEIQGY